MTDTNQAWNTMGTFFPFWYSIESEMKKSFLILLVLIYQAGIAAHCECSTQLCQTVTGIISRTILDFRRDLRVAPFSIDDVSSSVLRDLEKQAGSSRLALPAPLVKNQILLLGDFPLEVNRILNEGEYIELVDLKGTRAYLKREHVNGKNVEYSFIDRSLIPEVRVSDARSAAPVLEHGNTGLPDSADKDAVFAADLANRQIKNSKSWNESQHKEIRNQMQEALTRSNREMLALLRAKKNLTLENLNQWNLEVIRSEKSPTEEEITYGDIFGGVLRGTIQNRKLGNETVPINLTKLPAGTQPVSNMIVESTHPEKVESRMQALLQRVNALSPSSSASPRATLFEIIQIYREFLHVHGYRDGNGRVARVMLDYCLLRSGFPPAPAELGSARLVMFTSDEEALQNFLRSYQPDANK